MAKPSSWPDNIPYIDDSVRWLGVSMLRSFNTAELAGLEGAVVFHENCKPLAVMLPYDTYIQMQKDEGHAI